MSKNIPRPISKKPTSNKRKSEQTRDQILDTAWLLICERGAEVSIAEIAKAVGVTRQLIYVHFGSRSGLLLALVRRADVRERIFEQFSAAEALEDPHEQFRAYLQAWLAFVPKILPVATDLIRLRHHDEAAANAWQDRMDELHDAFGSLIQRMQEAGVLQPKWQVETATDLLWTYCSVQTWQLLTLDRGWSESKATEEIQNTLTQLLLTSRAT